MSITSARQDLAEALEGSGYLVFPQPLENIPVPSVTLVPHQPYVEVLTVGAGRLNVSFKATLMVAYLDNQAALINLETLMTKFLDSLPTGAGIQIGEFSQPGRTQNGPSEALATDIVVTITTNKE